MEFVLNYRYYYLVVQAYPLVALVDFQVPGSIPRLHTCISRKVYHMFSFDGIGAPDSTGDVSSSEDEEMPLVQPQILSSSDAGPSHSSTTTTSAPAPLQRTLSMITLPPAIWTAPWVAPPFRRYADVFASDTIAQNIYEEASRDTVAEDLDIRSTDVATVADMFKTLLGDAVDKGDFTDILSPNRTLLM